MFEQMLSAQLHRHVRSTPNVDPRVADAMMCVGRHRFLSLGQRLQAYRDTSLPIGFGQTISQPSFIAEVISAAAIQPTDRVLEVGTGSGFAAAVLSLLARDVTRVERIPELASAARRRLARLGFDGIDVITGDAWLADEVVGTFDAILIMAGAPRVPESAFPRLAPGGRLLVPVGSRSPNGGIAGRLVRITLRGGEPQIEALRACTWVPLIGKEGWPET
jgi:protein-L-isoaspartate(D-aspartate) O-methyltransferase